MSKEKIKKILKIDLDNDVIILKCRFLESKSIPHAEFLKLLKYHKLWDFQRRALLSHNDWCYNFPINTITEINNKTRVCEVIMTETETQLSFWKPIKTHKNKYLEGVILE